MADDGSATWLYAITDQAVGLPDAGVAGEHPRLVAEDDLVAVVGTVDLARFGGDALPHTLGDLRAVEGIARAHHGVVAHVARQAPTLGARLATVFRRDDAVVAVLHRQRHDLRDALARVAGRSEWGVKVLPRGGAEPEERPAPEEETGAGTRYLMRRRADLRALEDARMSAATAANEIHTALTGAAVDTKPVTNHTARTAAAMLNSAYLVDDDDADAFTALVTDLAARYPGVDIQLTGPWPAYSFAAVEPREPR